MNFHINNKQYEYNFWYFKRLLPITEKNFSIQQRYLPEKNLFYCLEIILKRKKNTFVSSYIP